MAADFASTPNTGITVQLCGDAHVLNFGLWKTPERNLSFDLRDFDETLPGPFEWDVKRLVASLAVLARDHGVPEKVARRSVRAAVGSYADAMRKYATVPEIDIWYDRVDVDELIGQLAPYDADEIGGQIDSQARKRTSRGASKKLTTLVDGRRRIIEDPPFRTQSWATMMSTPDLIDVTYRNSVPDHIWSLLSRFDLADAVRQVRRCRSVGTARLPGAAGRASHRRPAVPSDEAGGAVGVREVLGASQLPASRVSVVINGQRMIQSATGHVRGLGRRTSARTSMCVSSGTARSSQRARQLPIGWRGSPGHADGCWLGARPRRRRRRDRRLSGYERQRRRTHS